MTTPILELNNVAKRYGTTVALDALSLHVQAHEVLGALGPNGAGQTTAVECAIGLRTPDAGTVRVLGLDPTTDPDAVRQRVGVQLQEPGDRPPAVGVRGHGEDPSGAPVQQARVADRTAAVTAALD